MNIKENLIRAITFNQPDHIPYYNEGGIQNIYYNDCWPPEQGEDNWGVGWEKKIETSIPYCVTYPYDDINELLKTYKFPDPHRAGIMEGIDADIDAENNFIIAWQIHTLFERSWQLLGLENVMMAMAVDQDALAQLYSKIADYQIEIAKQYVKLDIDAVFIGDDYGSQKALIMSPAVWRKLIKPELARIFAVYKEAGKFVIFHSCGCVMDIVGDLAEIGVDVLNPVQAHCNDLAKLKKEFGNKLSFWGGVDTQHTMTMGTPDEVRSETLLRIKEVGDGGGYIIAPDQTMPFPQENIDAFVETVKLHGKYSDAAVRGCS